MTKDTKDALFAYATAEGVPVVEALEKIVREYLEIDPDLESKLVEGVLSALAN